MTYPNFGHGCSRHYSGPVIGNCNTSLFFLFLQSRRVTCCRLSFFCMLGFSKLSLIWQRDKVHRAIPQYYRILYARTIYKWSLRVPKCLRNLVIGGETVFRLYKLTYLLSGYHHFCQYRLFSPDSGWYLPFPGLNPNRQARARRAHPNFPVSALDSQTASYQQLLPKMVRHGKTIPLTPVPG